MKLRKYQQNEIIPLYPKPVGLYNKLMYTKNMHFLKKTKLNESLYFMYLSHNRYREIYKLNNVKLKEINYKNNVYHGYYKEWKNSDLRINKLYYKGKILLNLDVNGILSLKEMSLCHLVINNLEIDPEIFEINIY